MLLVHVNQEHYVAPPNFVIKIVDKDGAREYAWRESVKDRKVEPERGEEFKKLRGNHAWGGEGFAILTIMAHESIKMNGRVINISHAPH
ncbi:hypothetical protein JHK82_024644 [Glycine max]|nr:hypothetical protein JHK85_025247 [Glycine max]KAG5012488.1 hypothetical protein JHK86_024749 [Glycine max]KAG5133456.1 hypothetical protein JHK82_024644 [Glycine max]